MDIKISTDTKFLLNDVRKPTKSVKSSRKAEEQAPGGLYTLAITVDTVLDLAETTIDLKDSISGFLVKLKAFRSDRPNQTRSIERSNMSLC